MSQLQVMPQDLVNFKSGSRDQQLGHSFKAYTGADASTKSTMIHHWVFVTSTRIARGLCLVVLLSHKARFGEEGAWKGGGTKMRIFFVTKGNGV